MHVWYHRRLHRATVILQKIHNFLKNYRGSLRDTKHLQITVVAHRDSNIFYKFISCFFCCWIVEEFKTYLGHVYTFSLCLLKCMWK